MAYEAKFNQKPSIVVIIRPSLKQSEIDKAYKVLKLACYELETPSQFLGSSSIKGIEEGKGRGIGINVLK